MFGHKIEEGAENEGKKLQLKSAWFLLVTKHYDDKIKA
jgi:hypothetical protein